MTGLDWLLHGTNSHVLQALCILSFIYLVFGLDDLFIDLVAFGARLKPTDLSSKEIRSIHTAPEKQIAIIVPAWKEGDIIDRMLAGNISRIDYGHYHFFVGVYPNDPQTVAKVEAAHKQFPHVHAVVNYRNGPSSKGQILNHVVGQILEYEKTSGISFEAFLMQDAEDLIHPKVLKLVNREIEKYAFVQIPVFSLGVNLRELIAGIYVDEFAESHTKDILVREWMGAAVPSAGVGTALSRNLVLQMLRINEGSLFNEGSLTEDYELGVRAHALGFRPHVACCSYRDAHGKREFIATREYFPKRFSRSVRQKTRWTVGIALQGWRNLGWMGGMSNRYFLVRDRKGVLTNAATFLGYPLVAWAGLYSFFIDAGPASALFARSECRWVLSANLALMCLRLFQRTRCVARVYGARAALPVIVRWPLGNTVNALAAFHAVKNDVNSRFNKVSMAWVKTEHELPQYFGQRAPQLEVAR